MNPTCNQPTTGAGRQKIDSQITCSNLISSQKEEKKLLKSRLKFQRRVHKLETRIAHAISRKDPVVEQQARKDLDLLLRSQPEYSSVLNTGHHSTERAENADHIHDAIEEVTLIFRQLLASLNQNTQQYENSNSKEVQNTKARHLLQHMTKGTQTQDMFRDVTALRGYVRKKFHGRAALIIKSLCKLSPEALQMAPEVSLGNQMQYNCQREIISMCYSRLLKVQSVLSIGCGPGNDVVGLIAFLRACCSNQEVKTNGKVECKLKEVLFLDFAINEWQEAALNDLIPILQSGYVDKISCKYCDVTMPLLPRCKIECASPSEVNEETTNDSSIANIVPVTNMFLTSYLLSETRNNWDEFYVQLVKLAPVGALFYFAEPMAWQLHRLRRLSTPCSTVDDEKESEVGDLSPLHRLRFIWIDSSMHYPELQQMDGRAGGPAVLLAIKI